MREVIDIYLFRLIQIETLWARVLEKGKEPLANKLRSVEDVDIIVSGVITRQANLLIRQRQLREDFEAVHKLTDTRMYKWFGYRSKKAKLIAEAFIKKWTAYEPGW